MTHQTCSVLIIDDTPEDRSVYRRFLERDRERVYMFREATSAEQGIAMCHQQLPDIALIDYMLPDDDGLSLLATLVETFGKSRFAILMLTGSGDESIAVQAMKLGAHDYMVKHTNLEQPLILAIQSALQKVQLQQQIEQQRRDLQVSNEQLRAALSAQQASSNQLFLALQAAKMATWELDLRTGEVHWSEGLEQLAGVPSDTHGNNLDKLFAITHPDDQIMLQHQIDMALASDTLAATEFRIVRPDAVVAWIEVRGHVERDDHGAPTCLTGIAIDITERKRAEADLRRRDNEFKMLVENAPDIIARFDRQLRHMYVSPTAARVTGIPQEAFIGKTNRDLGMPLEQCDLWDEHIVRVFDTGVSSKMEFAFLAHDGLHYYQATMVPEVAEDGHVESVMSVARDLTAYKTAEARVNFLSDASTALTMSLDQQTTLDRIARLTAAYFGDGCEINLLDDHIIRNVAAAHPDPETETLFRDMRRRYPVVLSSSHPVAQVFREGRSLYVETVSDELISTNTYNDDHAQLLDQLQPMSFVMVPVMARDNTIGVISLHSFKTPRTYTGEDMSLLEELSRRAAMALDNAQLYHEAQEAIREREAFISIASHEVKNPLTSLLGRAQMLQRRLSRLPDSERAQSDVEIVINQGRRINALLTDLLDVSRLTSSQFTIIRKPVDLNQLLTTVVTSLQESAPERIITLQINPQPTWVNGDAGRLEQMFYNLLNNAIKYSPNGGTVAVTVAADATEATVAISDEGIGIPEDALPHLFKRFYRVGNNSQQISGSGIGLYVVKEIVNGHNGSIDVVSVANQGSTFTVTLPLTTPDNAPEQTR